MRPFDFQPPHVSAGDLNDLAALARESHELTGDGVEVTTGSGGTQLVVPKWEAFDAKITERSGTAYGWAEVYAKPDGTWAVLTEGRKGAAATTPAYERNASATVAVNTVVRMRWRMDKVGTSRTEIQYVFDSPAQSTASPTFVLVTAEYSATCYGCVLTTPYPSSNYACPLAWADDATAAVLHTLPPTFAKTGRRYEVRASLGAVGTGEHAGKPLYVCRGETKVALSVSCSALGAVEGYVYYPDA